MLKLLLCADDKKIIVWSEQTWYISFCNVANVFIASSGRLEELDGTDVLKTSFWSFSSEWCFRLMLQTDMTHWFAFRNVHSLILRSGLAWSDCGLISVVAALS